MNKFHGIHDNTNYHHSNISYRLIHNLSFGAATPNFWRFLLTQVLRLITVTSVSAYLYVSPIDLSFRALCWTAFVGVQMATAPCAILACAEKKRREIYFLVGAS